MIRTDEDFKVLISNDIKSSFLRHYEMSLKLSGDLHSSNWRMSSSIECDMCNLLNLVGRDTTIHYYGGCYYFFDGMIYVVVSEDLIGDAFREVLTEMNLKMTQKKRYSMFRNEFLAAIRLHNRLRPSRRIVAFTNGVLTLDDLEFHKHGPEFHVTSFKPFAYDEMADCPKWSKFLKEVLPDRESRRVIQMFMGLSLIERGSVLNPYAEADTNKVELCLILIGDGANGKSVIYQTMMGIFGKGSISNADYDELTSMGDEGMRNRRLLQDCTFNWSSDSDARTFGRKRSGVFKRIVSGEPVTSREIGGNVQQMERVPYLIFNFNALPAPDDTSYGFIRRLQFVSFDVTIPPARQNKHLAHDLIEEYPGIFNWIVRGSKEIRRRKFVFCYTQGGRRQALLSMLKTSPVMAWVSAFGIRHTPGDKGEAPKVVPGDKLRRSLERFCEDNDVETPSDASFGIWMNKLGFTKKRTSTGRLYEVYGVTAEALTRHFVIKNEAFPLDDIFEEDGYFDDMD